MQRHFFVSSYVAPWHQHLLQLQCIIALSSMPVNDNAVCTAPAVSANPVVPHNYMLTPD